MLEPGGVQAARYSTAATVFVVTAATCGRINAYARRSWFQLARLLACLLACRPACIFFGLLVSYKTLATIFHEQLCG